VLLHGFLVYNTLTDLIICFQEDIEKIPNSELTDSTKIGQGGFGIAYRAKHRRLGTVVYKKLNEVKKLYDEYATVGLVLQHCIQYMHFQAAGFSTKENDSHIKITTPSNAKLIVGA